MEKVERINNDLENNWWNYEIYLRSKMKYKDEEIEIEE